MKIYAFALSACLLLGVGQANAQQLKLQENNVDEIVKAMTLEEKARLLVGGRNESFGGGNSSTVGSTQALVPGAAGTTQGIERLGIPPTVLADGPAGIRISPTRPNDPNTYYGTGFPVGTALASTWDVNLVEAVGKAIGEEVLEYGADVLLAPGMNIHRSPLCGRNFEYYSEDPIVTGLIATAYVKGVQSNGVGVSLKHYAANSQETNRTGVNEVVSQRALREIYLKGFEIAVKESAPWTVMSSYNRLNGPLTQENKELLTTVLRDEWGFDGIVMTDWIGKRNTVAQVQAGNDLMEPGMPEQSEEIVAKVKSGELAIEEVDICVKRILEYIVKTPRFKGYKYSNKPALKEHAAITRQSATEGMVLLKNEEATLPLKGIKNVALFGITSYDFIAGGTGSGNVNKPYVIDLMQGLTNVNLSVTESIKDLYTKYKAYQESKIESDRLPGGWRWGKAVLPEMSVSRTAIDKQAKEADIAILTIGRQAGEGGDRVIEDDFNLTDVERQLLDDICDAFHAEGKRVVVIINTGGVIETASWKSQPDAILLAWQPGQEGGNSVADVLVGKENPSGKLTMTFPIAAMDHPSSLNYPINLVSAANDPLFPRQRDPRKNVDYTLHQEGINVGYRYFNTVNKAVSYPFGYGLSYTNFAYSKATVKATGNGFTASIVVTNTGKTAGKEVVQLYVSAPKGGLKKPATELKSFAKTKLLQPGESQTLTFKVSNYDLASFDEAIQSWVSAKGQYTVKFGASVEDVRATGSYTLSKEFTQKVNDVLRPDMELNEY
ncbi:beta-glucosidase [Parabacteroides sp. PFB2-12]|uniref:glycoside hydrolase family 3 C-terminal domain-containing protein n=1 Tax=unclassified Parabacteroides TaxID=2649774 RepID=UPI00247438B2|nr:MULTISPECIES: glycoside hydrolase family 3 C-terminal domain-containing protein [unclassified Parabacteroides]MDH6343497.1 beta-glucosidase [Parabacteroides sp. PM6-13]MDH6390903.1 beta-glucosidase [Parabacteroides sp. PFB2-12]